MFKIEMETKGLKGWWKTLIGDTQRDALPPAAKAGEKIERRMFVKLSMRGGPSRAGDPPAMDTGDLREGIGRTGPFSTPGMVTVVVGYGVGDDAMRRIRKIASDRGMEIGELFGKANIHEHGGIGAAGRRFPQRSYVRSTFDEMEAEVVADIRRAL